ncbi:MAG: cell wall metabolism sensor histidine kinase WalK [Abditibacteriales bacterium]|nr:cell wall metabolism sensor histidine kinase WalK [Abditibacteriales bacterium]MDW8366653.1 ATP-binding protein [Abditibacteriales bacterium]
MSLRWRLTFLFTLLLAAALAGVSGYALRIGIQVERLMVGVLIIGVISVLLCYWTLGNALAPLAEARQAAQRLGGHGGDLSHQDEIGELTTALNALSLRLLETQAELQREKEKSEAMLTRMADGIIVTDVSGRIVLFNPAAERIFGLPAQRALGRTVTDIFMDYDLSTMLTRALGQGVPQTAEVKVERPQERILNVFVTLVETEGRQGHGAVIVLHDLTEIRRLENIRRDFVANVSHELRTPVASLRAMAETLLMGAKDDPEAAQQFLETMLKETERLSVLLDDLLELARIEAGKREPRKVDLNLRELVETVLNKLRPHAERKQLNLAVDVPEDLTLRADPDAMQQILVNLLDNAIKYTPSGGSVTVTGKVRGNDGIPSIPFLSSTSPSLPYVVLSVSDTGVGIPHEHLPRIFERFYRVDKARSREMGGTGLGLSIVKHLVEMQGGKVTVESAVGRGSVFTVTLPIN